MPDKLMDKPIYSRVLLKLSGEALTGELAYGIDPKVLHRLGNEIHEVVKLGVQVGIVIGGGNLFRGAALSQAGLDRITGDHMGILATMMNALALRDIFSQLGLDCRVMSAVSMSGIMDQYDRRKALHHLQHGRVMIFAGGTGNPLVTTDSAASLRAIEIGAELLLKATNVDGIYSADPAQEPQAKMYRSLTYQQVLREELGVMDLNAFCQCRDHQIKLQVFNINKPQVLRRVILGDDEGTLVHN
ncbi:MAG: UMP kinase [Gammaproteobacteria bacterium]|nr:UMP kinase [Gammaproteobacteria bacterium]